MSAVMQGTRLDHDTCTYVPADAAIRPTRDHLVIEPLNWRPSTILEVTYYGKPLRGRVLAIGAGHYPIRYNGPKGKRTKSWDSERFQPTEVKVGDVVELGGLELRGYLFTTFFWGNKRCMIAREADVAIIHEV